MFAQGGLCFFCKKVLPKSEASVEHLVASANGGRSNDENCVACCRAINALLGRMSLKEKIQVALNQRGHFKCPHEAEKSKSQAPPARSPSSIAPPLKSPGDRLSLIVSDLRKRGSAKPRTVKALTSTISALFQKKLAEEELLLLLKRLQTQGVVVVNGTRVSYLLPQQ